MTKLKSAKEKLNELIDIMPFELSESIRPYILEYGKILQQNAIEAALDIAANETTKFEYNSPIISPTTLQNKRKILSLINHPNLKV